MSSEIIHPKTTVAGAWSGEYREVEPDKSFADCIRDVVDSMFRENESGYGWMECPACKAEGSLQFDVTAGSISARCKNQECGSITRMPR